MSNFANEGMAQMPSQTVNKPLESTEKDKQIQELIDNAVEPRVWKEHLVKDLMKFWTKPAATNFQGDLFPTYRMNNGELLPENREIILNGIQSIKEERKEAQRKELKERTPAYRTGALPVQISIVLNGNEVCRQA